MTFHSSSRERTRLEQHIVRHAQLADIVQQASAPQVDEAFLVESCQAGQVHGHFGHAQGMAFCFPVAQVECMRPAFDRGIIGMLDLEIASLQMLEQRGVVDGDGGLTRQRLQEIDPFRIGQQRHPVENLEHALDFSLGDQRYAIIADEVFAGYLRCQKFVIDLAKIQDVNCPSVG